MAEPGRPSPLVPALWLAVIVVGAVVLGVVGVPLTPVALTAAGLGVFVVARYMIDRRTSGAVAREPDIGESFALRIPAERVAVGKALQFRLLPSTRKVWAPGLLCAAPGRLRFVPSEERHADRVWEAAVDRVEVVGMTGRAATVRSGGSDDPAQFVVMASATDVAAQLVPFVVVDVA